MRKASFLFGPIFLSLVLFTPIATAQHVQILSDQQWIELGIDLLRKGIQEEDTMKINMVLAPEVSVYGDKAVASTAITQRFQSLFEAGSNRTMRLAKPAFSRHDSPRHNSDFWDFDILDPKITFSGDTAVVECELVLWGAPPDGINRGPGRKIEERLVFVSPTTDEVFVPSEENAQWPSSANSQNSENSRKSWKLFGFEKIHSFLGSETLNTSETARKVQEGN